MSSLSLLYQTRALSKRALTTRVRETPEQRSRTMRAVKGANTAPELLVRRITHSLGYRFRLHRSDLPGKPDLVFVSRKKVIFVHGCFWHGHKCPRGDRMPKTNAPYWKNKIARNAARDKLHIVALRKQGWQVAVIWECKLKDPGFARRFLSTFLGRT